MSITFTKLFNSITESTVWGEPAGTRLVWITLLAKSDRHGRIFASIPGLARMANVTLQECERAVATFFAPDPYSRTPDHEGRRIEAIDGGWRLLNHAKYRDMRDEETRREQNRAAKQRQRAREEMSAKDADSQLASARSPVMSAHADADADADAESKDSNSKGRCAQLVLPPWLPTDVWQEWHTYRNSRKGWTHRARLLSLRSLTELWAQGNDPSAVIDQSIERGWTALFPVQRRGASHEASHSVSAADRVAANIERARARRQQAEPIEGKARRLTG